MRVRVSYRDKKIIKTAAPRGAWGILDRRQKERHQISIDPVWQMMGIIDGWMDGWMVLKN